jgi:hypothetical protein
MAADLLQKSLQHAEIDVSGCLAVPLGPFCELTTELCALSGVDPAHCEETVASQCPTELERASVHMKLCLKESMNVCEALHAMCTTSEGCPRALLEGLCPSLR